MWSGLLLAAGGSVSVWHERTQSDAVWGPALLDQAQLARNLAEGRGLTTSVLRPGDVLSAKRLEPVPDAYQPPLVPLLLASAFALSQPDDRSVGLTLAAVHVALSLAVFMVGARLFGLTTAVVAALLWAAGWSSLRLDFGDLKSPLVAVLLLAIGAFLAVPNGSGDLGPSSGEHPARPLPWFRIGVLAGLVFLTEYSAALAAIVLATWCGVTEGTRRWRRVGALGAGLACCVVPWGLRNARVAGNPLHTMAKLHVLADTSYFPGSSVFRREDARGLSVVGFLVQHPRSLVRKAVRSWQRLAEGSVPGMSWPLAGLCLAGLLTGFGGAGAAALAWWAIALAGCGMVAAALTGSPLALLPSVMPMVTLLASHYLVEVIRERVGEDPLVIGGKGRLIAMSRRLRAVDCWRPSCLCACSQRGLGSSGSAGRWSGRTRRTWPPCERRCRARIRWSSPTCHGSSPGEQGKRRCGCRELCRPIGRLPRCRRRSLPSTSRRRCCATDPRSRWSRGNACFWGEVGPTGSTCRSVCRREGGCSCGRGNDVAGAKCHRPVGVAESCRQRWARRSGNRRKRWAQSELQSSILTR